MEDLEPVEPVESLDPAEVTDPTVGVPSRRSLPGDGGTLPVGTRLTGRDGRTVFVVGKDGERYEEPKPHYPVCEACKGDGMVNEYHAPLSGQGDYTARMGPCRRCGGKGEDRSKPMVGGKSELGGKDTVVRFGDEEEMKVVPVEVKKWGVLYGVMEEGADPKDRKSYKALFTKKEEAERYASA